MACEKNDPSTSICFMTHPPRIFCSVKMFLCCRNVTLLVWTGYSSINVCHSKEVSIIKLRKHEEDAVHESFQDHIKKSREYTKRFRLIQNVCSGGVTFLSLFHVEINESDNFSGEFRSKDDTLCDISGEFLLRKISKYPNRAAVGGMLCWLEIHSFYGSVRKGRCVPGMICRLLPHLEVEKWVQNISMDIFLNATPISHSQNTPHWKGSLSRNKLTTPK